MSNEQDSATNSGESDERVSDIYRELAVENTPARLDRLVLQLAVSSARRRYLPAAPWMRPVAWAAVIGLSLAIVLQISRLPTPEIDAVEVPPAEARALKTEQQQAAPEPNEVAVEMAPARMDQGRAAAAGDAAVDPLPPPAAESRAAAGEPSQYGTTTRAIDRMAVPATALEREVVIRESAEQAAPADRDSVRQPEDLSRLRTGDSIESGAVESGTAYSSAATTAGCDEDDRASRSTWLECIAELEQAGYTDLARDERERLLEVFPETEAR